jgi:hypothetical protein
MCFTGSLLNVLLFTRFWSVISNILCSRLVSMLEKGKEKMLIKWRIRRRVETIVDHEEPWYCNMLIVQCTSVPFRLSLISG